MLFFNTNTNYMFLSQHIASEMHDVCELSAVFGLMAKQPLKMPPSPPTPSPAVDALVDTALYLSQLPQATASNCDTLGLRPVFPRGAVSLSLSLLAVR